MLDEQHIRYLAPQARDDYVATLTSEWGWSVLSHYQIAPDLRRLAGFLGNVMVETGQLTVEREAMAYVTAARLRVVWPSRFGNKTDAQLAPLLHNGPKLAEAVYAGRMGNQPGTLEEIAAGTNDAYVYRGWGILQCTGKSDTIKYCSAAKINPQTDPTVLDDKNVSLIVACAEWYAGNCNAYMDMDAQGRDGFGMASAVINVGSPNKIGAVEDLASRRQFYARALAMFQLIPDDIAMPPPHGDAVDLPHWTEAA